MLEDIEALIKHLTRHRFLYVSLVLHATVLTALYYHGPFQIYQAEHAQQTAQANEYVRQAEYKELENRVDDMREMESMIEKIADEKLGEPNEPIDEQLTQSEPNSNPQKTEGDGTGAQENSEAQLTEVSESQNGASQNQESGEPGFDDVVEEKSEESSNPMDMLALLKNAKDIAEHAQTLRDELRAEQMSDLLDIPVGDALDMLQQEGGLPENLPNMEDVLGGLGELSDEQIREAIQSYHQNTRENLAEVLQGENQQQEGISVESGGEGSSGGQGTPGEGFGGLMSEAQDLVDSSARRFALNEPVSQSRQRQNETYDHSLPSREQRPAVLGQKAIHPGAGRIFGEGGEKADQVFIGSWYWIGPFEFLGRENRDKPHPPEFAVDLEAFYPGKQGMVGWKFHVDNEYPLEPPKFDEYAVFYGYNEVHFEEETTAWVATACDDDCKLWVNEELVWRSGDQRKAWYTNSGYRSLKSAMANRDLSENYYKVTFKKGTNKLLFRLDNTWSHVFFSMTINRHPT